MSDCLEGSPEGRWQHVMLGSPFRPARLDLDVVCGKMRDRLLGSGPPHEAEVAVPGPHRIRRVETLEAGTVNVQLPAVESVTGRPFVSLLDLGAEPSR